MRSTNQPLTDRELIYVNNQFKIIRFKNKLPWIICGVFVCLGLLGMIVFEGQMLFFGILFMAFAIIGIYFFKRNSYQTTYDILPTGLMHQGVLSTTKNGRKNLFLDDYRLETPNELENHCSDLVEIYKNQKVNATLAVLEEKKGLELHANHYLPLKIEYELCIESAIKNHGANFLKNVTRQPYSIITTLLLFLSIPLLIIFALDFFGYLNIVPLLFSMFLALCIATILQEKFIPTEESIEEIELKEKLKCTCL